MPIKHTFYDPNAIKTDSLIVKVRSNLEKVKGLLNKWYFYGYLL